MTDNIRHLLQAVIRAEPLPEQILAFRLMYRVARGALEKPDFIFNDLRAPTAFQHSPTQASLFSLVRNRELSSFNLIVHGNAGCSKTTLYLALASMFKVVVVVPSNELRTDIETRAAIYGVNIVVFTQHEVFACQAFVTDSVLLIDEIFLLPEWHIRAIAALSPRVIGFGDPWQTQDLGFGQMFLAPLQPRDNECIIELPTSFTVPQDVMALAISFQLVPPHYRTISRVETSMFKLRSICSFDCPAITGSRECKAGYPSEKTYTIVTVQGARFEDVVVHSCDRDLAVFDPNASFGSGINRNRLLWTMLSRHSRRCYLDFSPTFYRAFGPIPASYAEDDDVIKYFPTPQFEIQVFDTPSHFINFHTFTPVTVSFVSPFIIKVYNNNCSKTLTLRAAITPFHDILLVDDLSLPNDSCKEFVIIRTRGF